jgi:hypothetical protein
MIVHVSGNEWRIHTDRTHVSGCTISAVASQDVPLARRELWPVDSVIRYTGIEISFTQCYKGLHVLNMKGEICF